MTSWGRGAVPSWTHSGKQRGGCKHVQAVLPLFALPSLGNHVCTPFSCFYDVLCLAVGAFC